MSVNSNAALILHLDQWPAPDRIAWDAGRVPGSILDGRAYAEDLRPTTIRNAARGYGRWLAFLQKADPSALQHPPGARVTPQRVRLFLAALQAAGNTNNTIKARFWELRATLRIMLPDHDFRWLNYPAGQSLHAMLPTVLQPVGIMDIHILEQWGQEMMAAARDLPVSLRRSVLHRNGLLVAILANRAPRIRSLADLRVGRGIFHDGACYRLEFSAAETKGKRRLGYALHRSLITHIDHYLAVERPILLGMKTHDWFWVGNDGDRFGIRGIEGALRRASMARFGHCVGTHSFRHALATASMIANPTTPGTIAAVLGNSPAVVEAHYALGGQLEAGARFQDVLEQERAQTAALARQLF